MNRMPSSSRGAGRGRWAAALALAGAIILAGCATAVPAPQTFNQRALYAEAMTTATGRTCVDLSKRERISVGTLVRCREVVMQAGALIDTARVVGGQDGVDRLVAVQSLLLQMEADLRAAEIKQ